MNQGRRYLLVFGCLLISLVPLAQAQQHAPQRPMGFVPKHLQMQHVRGPRRRAATNPFANRVQPPANQAAGVAPDAANGDSIRPMGYDELAGDSPAAVQPIPDTSAVADSSVVVADDQPWIMDNAPMCGVPGIVEPCGALCAPTFWFSADYLAWSTRDAMSPVLATTSVAGTAREAAGVLDEPGVSTLFGGNGLHGDLRSGARFTLGGWFSPQRNSGIRVSYFAFGEDEELFQGSSGAFSILARPFYNMQLFEEDSRLINFPDLVRGDLRIRSTSEFDSLEVMFLAPVPDSCGATHVMVGYREANLDETIRFDESTVSLVSPTLDSTFDLFDQFDVDNSFYGYQIAFQHNGRLGPCWTYDLTGKAAIGSTHSRLAIDGQTVTTTANGDTSTSPEGLLALSTNRGSQSDYELSSLFELGLNFRRCFQNGLQLRIGYSYLHWSRVLRAAEQIDRTITPTEIPPDTRVGPERPQAPFRHSGFWAQGLNVGLEYQF